MTTTGARLREARHEKGLSLHDVERATGLRSESLSRWETGHREPRLRTVCILARLYGKPLEFFCPDEAAA